jgi:hypothetical protein
MYHRAKIRKQATVFHFMRKGGTIKNLQTFLLIAPATLIVSLFGFGNFSEPRVYGHDFAPREIRFLLC